MTGSTRTNLTIEIIHWQAPMRDRYLAMSSGHRMGAYQVWGGHCWQGWRRQRMVVHKIIFCG